jgi:hypothetical protein
MGRKTIETLASYFRIDPGMFLADSIKSLKGAPPKKTSKP